MWNTAIFISCKIRILKHLVMIKTNAKNTSHLIIMTILRQPRGVRLQLQRHILHTLPVPEERLHSDSPDWALMEFPSSMRTLASLQLLRRWEWKDLKLRQRLPKNKIKMESIIKGQIEIIMKIALALLNIYLEYFSQVLENF